MLGIIRLSPACLSLGLLALLGVVCGIRIASSRAAEPTGGKREGGTAPAILSPLHRSVLLSGRFDVIYRGEEVPLRVNSQERDWESSYASPVRVGHLRLSPGMHRLQIGDQSVEVCVALNEMEHDGPSDWPISRSHPMSPEEDRCADCHRTKWLDERLVVEQVRSPESCLGCHRAGDLEEPHEPFGGVPKDCRECHVLHASPYRPLLKAPRSKILEQHSAGRPN